MRAVCVVIVLGVVAVASPAIAGGRLAAREASAGNVEFFVGPIGSDGGAGCQMADVSGQAFVTCQSHASTKSGEIGQSATLHPDGSVELCHARGSSSAIKCKLGNAGEGTRTLGVGKQKTVGRFQCKVSRTGVTCTLRSNGKGFFMSLSNVKRVGGAKTYVASLQLTDFLSPDRHVWCAMSSRRTDVYCVAGNQAGNPPPAYSAWLTSKGEVSLCSKPVPGPLDGCVPNFDVTAPVLASGKTTAPTGYPFVCKSSNNAITCTLDSGKKKGTGFRVTRNSAVKVHQS